MKKSVVSLILCITVVLCGLLSVNAVENDSLVPTIELSSKKVLAGETFDVDIKIKNNPGITALQLSINFDDNVFELTGVEHKNLFSNISTCNNKYMSPFKLSWYSQQSLDENNNGTLATLHFRTLSDVPKETYTISVSYDEDNIFDSSFNNVYFKTQNSEISICDIMYGDVNNDGKINMKDIALLQKYLNKYDCTLDSKAADVYFDNAINMKDIVLLQKYLNGYNVTLGKNQQSPKVEPVCSSFVYGKSEKGRDLVCYSFTPSDYEDTVLLNFAIHGYEDEYPADGQVLVDTANTLIEYYKSNTDKLCKTRLLIVPCANPDGLYDGYTNNGFGRCNANGVDLNRDFDANYVSSASSRNYTSYAFSASESRALRDLVTENNASVVLDLHGWLNETIGDYELGSIFAEEMDLQHYVSYTDSNGRGYFTNWAHQQGAVSLLVEFKNSTTVPIDKLEKSVNRILSKDYPMQTLDKRYENFDKIECYLLDETRETTYRFVDVPFDTVSYIDGKTDKVTILGIYDNGWIKTQYPTSSGSKIGYCKLSAFIPSDSAVNEPYEISVNNDTNVYRRSDMAELLGKVYSTDKATVVAEKANMLQIIYPLDNGGYKMGWIDKNT